MKKILYYVLAFTLTLNACKTNDPALPDNTVSFTAAAQGIDAATTSATVNVNLSRNADAATTVTIELAPNGVAYGTQFTTEPAAVNNVITLTIPAGSNTASFKINKAAGIFLNGNEYVNLTVKTATAGALVGTTSVLKFSFAAITSTGSELTLNGGDGGSAAVNSVYVDLSANAQTSVARTSWDLGFYNGDDFRVILNNTSAASVVAVNKTDLAAVTAADVTLADLELGFGKGTFTIFDDVNGDLTKTAVAQVSATDASNKVYVLNRVGGSGALGATADLIKFKVLRTTNGYTLQYAKIGETTTKSITITKNTAFNFNFISFTSGAAVNVEPAKDRWDLIWTYSIYYTGTTPYAFSDLVFTNYLGGVQTAEIVGSYDAFVEASVSAVTFSTSRNTIAANWRNTTGTVGVKTDRFYVVKDASGNVYKLRFVSFTTQDGGTRGYPKIQYALVKKGA